MSKSRFPYVALLTAVISVAVSAQTIQVNKENRTIAITTSDQAEAIADVAVLSVGFTTYGPDQDSTYADGSQTSNAIIKALRGSGVSADSIESDNQNLSAIEDSDKVRWAKGIRFTFSQAWHVTVAAKDAATILHVAITSGANDSGGIQWKLANDDAVESEAAAKALAHAQQIAESMAKGLHTRLGALVYASNQAPQRTVFGYSLNTESASLGRAKLNLKPLAISPGRIEKTATVYAVFAIE
jgi:hypothetical protein